MKTVTQGTWRPTNKLLAVVPTTAVVAQLLDYVLTRLDPALAGGALTHWLAPLIAGAVAYQFVNDRPNGPQHLQEI